MTHNLKADAVSSQSAPKPKPQSLRVLPEEVALRHEGPLVQKPGWEAREDKGEPRALRSLSKIIEEGLCHRCGSCVGICPTAVLGLDQEAYPTVKNLSACTDCDLCVRVCPGDTFDFSRHHQELFGTPGDLRSTHGEFHRSIIAHAASDDLRDKATSGGLVTAILLHMLEAGEIDGAVVIASDEDQLWKGKPVVARTREELLESTKSKYAISPTNSVFNEILSHEGRYALVGLPCQIHGFHKAAELDGRLKERVVLTIGLFCHAAVEHEAFEVIWESLGDKKERATQFVSRIGKHPGAPHVLLDDGTLYPVYFGDKQGYRPSSMEVINVLYRLYTPRRCLTCFDALSEFADISVGDPWMAPPEEGVNLYDGWTFALLRTERADAAIQQLLNAKKIVVKDLARSEALLCNKQMATEKRWRTFRLLETRRRQGRSVPQYGNPDLRFPRSKGWQFIKSEIDLITHVLCYAGRIRPAVLRFFLGNGGYLFLRLNNVRRRLKFWLRDMREQSRRRRSE